MKEIETQTVRDQRILQATIELALSNVHRKKGKKYREMWKRKYTKEDMPVTLDEARKIQAALAAKFKIPKLKMK